MIKSLAAVIAALATMAFAPGASAQVATYDCKMTSLEGRGFIRDRVIFSINETTGEAGVVDDIVMHVYEKPIAADYEVLGNGQIRLNWAVENLKSGSQSFNLKYTLQYRPNSNAFNIRARVSGFDNRPFGSGSCRISKGQSVFGS